nr:MAG TPA: hypothetical protein [Caudoviricetes sp.]
MEETRREPSAARELRTARTDFGGRSTAARIPASGVPRSTAERTMKRELISFIQTHPFG